MMKFIVFVVLLIGTPVAYSSTTDDIFEPLVTLFNTLIGSFGQVTEIVLDRISDETGMLPQLVGLLTQFRREFETQTDNIQNSLYDLLNETRNQADSVNSIKKLLTDAAKEARERTDQVFDSIDKGIKQNLDQIGGTAGERKTINGLQKRIEEIMNLAKQQANDAFQKAMEAIREN